jgi:prophage tail gpP-like protein
VAFFDTKVERQGNTDAKDSTTYVTIVVNGYQLATKDYVYISDVLNMGDPFSCTVPNPDGRYSDAIKPGDPVKLYMSDSQVSGGANILFFTGIVVSRDFTSNMQGSSMRVTCADLGWHLQNNTAPVWMNLRGRKWADLLTKLIDPSWGIQGTSVGLTTKSMKVRLGRAGAALEVTPQAYPAVLPRIQVEPGETCADILIKYARLSKLLVNMTGDGVLQVFSPDYKTPNFYSFVYHKASELERRQNNVESVNINDSIQGVYTDVSCYSVVLIPASAYLSNNPNEGHFKGIYSKPDALPFRHILSFADAEQLSREQAKNRSVWKANRGLFDSFKYEVEVYGHQQNGSFYTPNTMCQINDTVHGIKGNYYVQAVKMERTNQGGTKTSLTLRKPNLLAA